MEDQPSENELITAETTDGKMQRDALMWYAIEHRTRCDP